MFFLNLPQNVISQNCLHLTPQVDKIILNERLNAKIVLMRELAKYKLEKLNQNLLPRANRNNCCTFIYIIDYLCILTIIYDFFQPIFIAFFYGFK